MTPNTNDSGAKRAVGRPLGSADKLKRTSRERVERDALAVLLELATNKTEDSAIRVQAAIGILAPHRGKTEATPNPAMALSAQHGTET